MIYKGLKIENTFAEAFNMKASRIIVTAENDKWAKHACDSFTGFATSITFFTFKSLIFLEIFFNT